MAAWKKIVQHDSDATLTSLTSSGNITAETFTGDGSGLTGLDTIESLLPLDPNFDSIGIPYRQIQQVQSFSPTDLNPIPVIVMDQVGVDPANLHQGQDSYVTGFMNTQEMSIAQKTNSGGTGPQYGGVSTNQSDANELAPWGTSANATGNNADGVPIGHFIYAETSAMPAETLFTLRTPKYYVPAGKTEKFIIYYHAFGSTIGKFKIFKGPNSHNRDGEQGVSFRWWNGTSYTNSTSIEGQQHGSTDHNFYRIEVTLSGEGYLFLDYTMGASGILYQGDFALDCGYLDSENNSLDFRMPDEDGNYSTRVRINPSGETHFDGDVVAFSSTISDERLKENIEPISNGLSAIKNLQGVSYDWKYKPGPRQLGLLAQQVESQVPEVVTEYDLPFTGAPSPDTPYKTVNYQLLVPHLIEAIKELNDRIEELESLLDN